MRRGVGKILHPVVARGLKRLLSTGCDPDLCALAYCLSAEPATFGGNDVGTWNLGGPFAKTKSFPQHWQQLQSPTVHRRMDD